MAVYKSKIQTKDGRMYFFRIKYKDILGNYHDYTSPKYKTSKEAKNEEALYRIDVQKQKTNFSNITIEDAFNEYMVQHKKEIKKQSISKIYDKYKHLAPIQKIKINSFNVTQLNQYLNILEKESLSIEYKNKILGILKRIIMYSNKYYNTQDNIIKFISNFKDPNSQKKEMNFYTYDEYKQYDSVIDNFEFHVLFEILYFMGLRKGELQALTWKDINFEKKELSITKTLTSKIKGEKWTISSPKTKNSNRILPIPENILYDLKKLLNNAQKYKDFNINWFVFGNVEPFRENTIQNRNEKYSELANLKHIRVHDFRHSCASLLISKGASITLVSKYLGHSKVSVTLDIYSHFYKSELIDITKLISNL